MIERVDSQLKKELAEILNNEIGDPRIDSVVSVLEVETSKDLGYAKVFVRAFGSKDIQGLVKALNAASSYIRNLLFKRMKIRTVPRLSFFEDTTLDNAYRIEKLLHEIKKENE